jgi:hypothetical protein
MQVAVISVSNVNLYGHHRSTLYSYSASQDLRCTPVLAHQGSAAIASPDKLTDTRQNPYHPIRGASHVGSGVRTHGRSFHPRPSPWESASTERVPVLFTTGSQASDASAPENQHKNSSSASRLASQEPLIISSYTRRPAEQRTQVPPILSSVYSASALLSL